MPSESITASGKETLIPIRMDVDIVTARQQGRALATAIGFTGSDLTLIATAISELGRNILEYAKQGEIVLAPVEQAGKKGSKSSPATRARASPTSPWPCRMAIRRPTASAWVCRARSG